MCDLLCRVAANSQVSLSREHEQLYASMRQCCVCSKLHLVLKALDRMVM